jgi:uncharacterized protein
VGEVRIVDNPDARRYEAIEDGEILGIAKYLPVAGRLIFTHTQVDSDLEGRGIGSQLAKGALEDVRRRGLRATLRCPFISSYVRRHPEYADIVDAPEKKGEE